MLGELKEVKVEKLQNAVKADIKEYQKTSTLGSKFNLLVVVSVLYCIFLISEGRDRLLVLVFAVLLIKGANKIVIREQGP